MAETPTDSWERKDVWSGLLFFAVGVLATGYAVLSARNGVPFTFWGAGAFVGPLLLLLGANAIYRSLRARR